jgi:hypothetical protein
VVTEAAGEKAEIDPEVVKRVTATLDAAQVAWTRLAKRWGELTSPDSRADPALTRAASEVRAAISATACTPTGWATPDQIANRVDLRRTLKGLHLSMVGAVDIAHVAREVATTHPTLTGPARVIAMRAKGRPRLHESKVSPHTTASRGQPHGRSQPTNSSRCRNRLAVDSSISPATSSQPAAGQSLQPHRSVPVSLRNRKDPERRRLFGVPVRAE